MWNYSDEEFIKIYRKLLKWEWYTDVNTKVLFLHCLLKANWKPGEWKGQKYKRGQFITSLPTLSDETGLTIQQVRTALSHLKSTGELTDKVFSKYRIITVVSFDKFQTVNRQPNRQLTGNQQATNRQLTADIRSKEYKELKEGEELYMATATHTPTLDEVRAYCRQRGNTVDPETFVAYYEQRGWKLSRGQPMKDWKAAIRYWEQNAKANDKFDNHPRQREHYEDLDRELFGI